MIHASINRIWSDNMMGTIPGKMSLLSTLMTSWWFWTIRGVVALFFAVEACSRLEGTLNLLIEFVLFIVGTVFNLMSDLMTKETFGRFGTFSSKVAHLVALMTNFWLPTGFDCGAVTWHMTDTVTVMTSARLETIFGCVSILFAVETPDIIWFIVWIIPALIRVMIFSAVKANNLFFWKIYLVCFLLFVPNLSFA